MGRETDGAGGEKLEEALWEGKEEEYGQHRGGEPRQGLVGGTRGGLPSTPGGRTSTRPGGRATRRAEHNTRCAISTIVFCASPSAHL